MVTQVDIEPGRLSAPCATAGARHRQSVNRDLTAMLYGVILNAPAAMPRCTDARRRARPHHQDSHDAWFVGFTTTMSRRWVGNDDSRHPRVTGGTLPAISGATPCWRPNRACLKAARQIVQPPPEDETLMASGATGRA